MPLLERIEGKLPSLLQPDILAPAQYLSTLRRNPCLAPEKQLMLAVLENGITCFQENLMARSSREKSLFREAEDWILDDASDGLYSFQNICEVLGLSPDYVRRGLLHWKETKLKGSRQNHNDSLIPRPGEKRPSQISLA